MSYFLGTAPQHGCSACLGADNVTAAGEMTKVVTIGAVALGALWFMSKRKRSRR
jgi:hypothetical protein